MTKDRIGVVTVTYNSARVLPEFLRCVFAQTYKCFYIIAVDNASTDRTLSMLEAQGDERLIVIGNSANVGIAEADNQGIRRAMDAGCSTILLLNNDTEFDENLFGHLIAGLATYSCDMVCPKMLYFDEPNRIWAAGGFFQPLLGYRTLHSGEGELDDGRFDEPRLVTFAPACCVLVRTDLFRRIGLMDPRYFVYSDDADFLYRAMKAGATLFYLPGVRLFHKVSSLTGGDASPFNIRYTTRNKAYFRLKHLGLVRATFWNWISRAYYLAKLLSFRSGFAVFRMRQRAISEAYSMARDT